MAVTAISSSQYIKRSAEKRRRAGLADGFYNHGNSAELAFPSTTHRHRKSETKAKGKK